MTGRTVAHYRLLDRLGQGAGGAVYRAEDSRLGRTVALKLLRTESIANPDLRRRFLQEARAASSLQHPNLCTVHDLGETDDGQLYIAMAYYEGGSLAERLAGGALAPDDAARITGEVAAGLAHAHAAGIMHRDLKPANIMFDGDGRAVVVDFGVARLLDSETLTEDGSLLGTLFYMSPEQVRGEPVGPASDVWSLGVVLYEMLVGERLFQGASAGAVLAAISGYVVTVPAVVGGADCATLARILTGSLQTDPAARRLGAVEIRDAVGSAPSATSDLDARDARTMVLPSTRIPRRRQYRWSVAVVLIALLVVVGAVGMTQGWFGSSAMPGTVFLPPTVVGGDERDQAFADGLVQALAASARRLEPQQDGAWIVPTEDVRFRHVHGVETAQGRMGAGVVVACTLRPLGDLLQIELVRHETLPSSWPRVSGPPEAGITQGTRDDLVGWFDDVRSMLGDLLGWSIPEFDVPVPGGTRNATAMAAYLTGLGYAWPFDGNPRPDLAIESFQSAIDVDPGFALAAAALAAVFREDNADGEPVDLTASLAAADLAIRVAPGLSEAHYQRGMTLRKLGGVGAAAALRRAVELSSDNALALTRLAEQYALDGNVAAADSVFRSVIELRPVYVTVRAYYGSFLRNQVRYDEAQDQFQRAIDVAPSFAPGLSNLGAVYADLGRLDEADAMLKRAEALEPDAVIYQNLATVAFLHQNFGDAAAYYEKSLQLDSGSHDVWGYAGECYLWSGRDPGRAQECFLTAAKLAKADHTTNPDDIELLLSRATYAAFAQDSLLARELLSEFLEAESVSPFLWFQAALIHELLGERDEAFTCLDTALQAGLPTQVIPTYPGFDRLRSSSGYAALEQKFTLDRSD